MPTVSGSSEAHQELSVVIEQIHQVIAYEIDGTDGYGKMPGQTL